MSKQFQDRFRDKIAFICKGGHDSLILRNSIVQIHNSPEHEVLPPLVKAPKRRNPLSFTSQSISNPSQFAMKPQMNMQNLSIDLKAKPSLQSQLANEKFVNTVPNNYSKPGNNLISKYKKFRGGYKRNNCKNLSQYLPSVEVNKLDCEKRSVSLVNLYSSIKHNI